MTRNPIAIIEAPSVLGLFPKGVETLPQALLAAGLVERLDARHAGRVEPPSYDHKRDPRDAVTQPARHRRLLGRARRRGDEGARRRASFRSCSAATARSCSATCSRSGGAALRAAVPRRSRRLLPTRGRAQWRSGSMDLALATRPRPGGRDGHSRGGAAGAATRTSCCLGRRDAEEAEESGSQRIEDTAIDCIDLAAVRSRGSRSRRGPRRRAPRRRRPRRLLDPPGLRRPRRCRHAGRRLPPARRAVLGRAGGRPSRVRRHPAATWSDLERHDLQPDSSIATARSRAGSWTRSEGGSGHVTSPGVPGLRQAHHGGHVGFLHAVAAAPNDVHVVGMSLSRRSGYSARTRLNSSSYFESLLEAFRPRLGTL